jgi:CubicO group peptidase (beta-lactamase class C family)
MERVTGKRLPQLVSEEIWQKMGAAESACFTVDPAGYALADGGFNACLRDYARFGLLLTRGGEGIVPAAWIAEARRGVCGTFSGRYELTLPRGGYHNQFWIEDDSSRSLLCRGVFGQLIYMNFETGVVAAKLSSWPEFVSPRLEIATLKAIHAIERHLG